MNGILTQLVTRRPIWIAGGVAGSVILLALLVLPVATRPCPVFTAFLPMYATTVFLVEGLTAYFLAIQFRATRELFLGALAGAYGYVMVLVTVQVMVFPGVFSPTGLLGAGPQSSIWIWVFWHGGFPSFVLLALLTRTSGAAWLLGPRRRKAGWWLMLAGPLIAAALCCYALAAHGALLPILITGKSYTALRGSIAGKMVIVTTIVALASCIQTTRLRDLLSLWVAVALVVSLADSVIVLTAASRYSLGWYTARMLSVVSSSVVLCVLIFEFSKLYRQVMKANVDLSERAMRDGLTGAFNRGYFGEQFQREFQRASRERRQLSLLLLDVDHFKRYNDDCGHQAGDQALIGIVAGIQNLVRRPGDFLARYGGEEFAIVLPGADSEGARARAETIRLAVTALDLPRHKHSGNPVTISLGVATFTPLAEIYDAEELIRRADAALYGAKHAGRNRVQAYGAAPMAAAAAA